MLKLILNPHPCWVVIVIFIAFASVVRSSGSFDDFSYCMRDAGQYGLRKCFGKSAINFLQTMEEQDNFTLFTDFVVEKDENLASRSIINFLEQDPMDFKGIMETAGNLFSQRSLQWHLDMIYPGLMFKVGPSTDSNSVAEFVMDSKVDDRLFQDEEPSTARILTKNFLLPMLLGFKFNLVTLVPIIFAAIALLLKKSLFLVKCIVYLTSVFGIGGAASLGSLLDGGWPTVRPGYGHAHWQEHWHNFNNGHFPGKLGLVDNYHSDVLTHDPDYGRNDRKLKFEKPRDFLDSATPSPDRFYDYEKSKTHGDRNGKVIKTRIDHGTYNDGWDGWHIIPHAE